MIVFFWLTNSGEAISPGIRHLLGGRTSAIARVVDPTKRLQGLGGGGI